MSDWDFDDLEDGYDDLEAIKALKAGGQSSDWGFGEGEGDFFDELVPSEEDAGSDMLQPINEEEDEAAKWLSQSNLDQVDPTTVPSELVEDFKTLNAQGNLLSELENITGKSNVDVTGQATIRTLALERFSIMEARQQAYAVNLIRSPALTGQRSSSDDISSASAIKAVKAFGNVLGEDPSKFADEIERSLKRINEGASDILQTSGPRKGQVISGRIRATTDPYEQKMVLGMLGVTQAVKLERGSGSALVGYHMSPEQQAKSDEDLKWLSGFIPFAASTYGDEATKKLEPELYDRRLGQTEKAIVSYLQEYHPGQPVIEYKTGLQLTDDSGNPIYQSTVVPLASDLDVFGIKGNASVSGSRLGSPYSRLEYASLFPSIDELTRGGTIQWDENVYAGSKASQYTEDQLRQLSPGAMSDYFSTERFGSFTLAKSAFKEFQKDMKRAKRIIGKESLTTLDENWGNTSRSMQLGRSEEELLRQEAFNAARVYEFGMQKNQSVGSSLIDLSTFSGKSKDQLENILGTTGTFKGSDKGGMYANEGMSETDVFVEMVMAGIPEEEAAASLLGENKFTSVRDVAGPTQETDRDRYLKRVAFQKSKGRFADQGTEAWLAEKKGLLSASMVKRINKEFGEGGQRDTANQLLNPKPFIGNKHTAEGSKWEALARRRFQSKSGLSVEDAFLEELEGTGMAVTPDGYVYNSFGEAEGLAEFKVHASEKGLEKSMKDYSRQLQLQMHVTGQKKVHFFRINKQTSNYRYSVVDYDQDIVDEILAGSEKVFKFKEDLVGKNLDIEPGNISARDQAEQEVERRAKVKSYRNQQVIKKAEVVKSYRGVGTNLDIKGEEESAVRLKEQRQETSHAKEITRMVKETKNFLQGVSKADGKEELADKGSLYRQMFDKISKGDEEDAEYKRQEKHYREEKESMYKKMFDEISKKEEGDDEVLKKQRGDEIRASKDAANSLRELGRSALNAVDGLAEMTSEGASTQMENMRVARAAGMDASKVLGQRVMLEVEGGLTKSESAGIMASAAGIKEIALDPATGINKYKQLLTSAYVIAERAGVEDFRMYDMEDLQDMPPEDIPSMIMDYAQQFPDRSSQAAFLGSQDMRALSMAMGEVSPESLRGATLTQKEAEARRAHRAIQSVKFTEQVIKEEVTNNLGTVGNVAVTSAAALTGVAGIAIASKTGTLSRAGAAVAGKARSAFGAARVIPSVARVIPSVARAAVAAAGSTASIAAISAASVATSGVVASLWAGQEIGSYLYSGVLKEETKDFIGEGVYNAMSYVPGTDAWDMRNAVPDSSIGNVKSASLPQGGKDVSVNTNVSNNINVSLGDDVVITRVEDNFGNSEVDMKPYGAES